ncbi:DUF1961 family protein [Neiella litorisoli]|uniref:DUF1961 family protein n=1 Tax=Neiella litorisoli TaxID=2771431 RepID=UPI0034E2EB80
MKTRSRYLPALLKASLLLLPISCSDMTTAQAPAAATAITRSNDQFEAVSNGNWQQVLFDSGSGDWRQHWLADGLIGSVENTPEGMHIKAGPEANNHAHHFVVWTKQSFSGDVKIEYEYTRTDDAIRYVNILYVLATGEGTAEFSKDIMDWADYRNEPYMRHYFDNMNAYHISYAAYGITNEDADKDYVRSRRYMPLENNGLKGTALEGDSFNTGFFKTGVPHQITVIKKGDELWMKVANDQQSQVYQWSTASHPDISEGRIGLRHMYTRSAIYKDFSVSTLSD